MTIRDQCAHSRHACAAEVRTARSERKSHECPALERTAWFRRFHALQMSGRDESAKKDRLTLKKRARSLPLFLVCNVLVVLSTSAGAATRPGGINGVFGMTGVVAGEVVRLTVVNGSPQASEVPTPCQFELSFVDAHGHALVDEDAGRTYLKRVTLASGAAESLEFVAPSRAVGIGNRIGVRPLVQQISPQQSAGCSPVTSAEIVDGAGRVIKVATPPDPCYPISPTDASCPTSRFGLFVLDQGRTARFSAAAYPQDAVASLEPIRVELSFVNADGLTIVGPDGKPIVTEVVLAPSVSSSLDLPATTANHSAVRPLIRQIFPSGPIPVATNLELLDSVTGAITSVAYPIPMGAAFESRRPPSLAKGLPLDLMHWRPPRAVTVMESRYPHSWGRAMLAIGVRAGRKWIRSTHGRVAMPAPQLVGI